MRSRNALLNTFTWLALGIVLLSNLSPAAAGLATLEQAGGSVQPVVYLPAVTRGISTPAMPSADACKLPEAANWGTIGLGFPRYADRLPSTGTVVAKVIFVDFSDAPAAQSPQTVYAMLSPGAADFYAATSYGRMNFVLEPTFQWFRMSKASTDYGWSSLTSILQRQYIQEAVNLADAQVNFAGADLIVVVANPDAGGISNGPAFVSAPVWGGVQADGETFYNGVTSGADLPGWGPLWLNHETGHTMGLVDLYAYDAVNIHRYVGGWDVMGMISGQGTELLAYQRWLLGWLDDSNIFCQQTASEIVQLTAVEYPGGIKAVMVPTGPTRAVVVESRRASGYDAGLLEVGALVYTIDSSIPTGSGPILIQPHPGVDKYQAPLGLDESMTVDGVTIRVLFAGSSGDVVEVTR